MIEKDTIRLLRECDAGIKMGVDSINDVLDYVGDKEMYRLLKSCAEGHERLGDELRACLERYGDEGKEMGIYPVHLRRSVLLGGEEIKLTEGEFRLFCCLFENRGRYVSREDLHKAVWQGEGDEGVVNVYVHYLLTKLEKNGQ